MKKIIAIVLTSILTVGLLISCGGKFECGLCGQKKSGKSYEVIDSEICEDCYKGIEVLGEMLK